MTTKSILVDGIFGAGKSTITKLISEYLNNQDIANEYYEEEADDNPLYLDYCESVRGSEETDKFVNKTLSLWKDFITSTMGNNKIFIVESTLYQNTVRILFNNLYDENKINTYYQAVLNILSPTIPMIIYLHKNNVSQHINNIWEIRGEKWKEYCITTDSRTLYAEKNNLNGEASTIQLWEKYQVLTDKLFQNSKVCKIFIETNVGCWDEVYTKIYNFINEKLV